MVKKIKRARSKDEEGKGKNVEKRRIADKRRIGTKERKDVYAKG